MVFYSKLHHQAVFGTTSGSYTIKILLRVTNKTTSGFKMRQNNHWIMHQNQWCFILNYTHRLLLVPQVGFTKFKFNPELQ